MILGVPTLCRYDLLGQLVQSVKKSTIKPSTILVVDNGCRIQNESIKGIEVIDPGRNVGVAGAWNYLAEEALQRGEYLVLSNDDIELGPESIERLLNSKADVAGRGFALTLIKPDVFQAVGAFDENFWPAYFEDNDYLHRIAVADLSFENFKAEDLGCVHHGSKTLQSFSNEGQLLFAQQFRELEWYYRKKWGGVVGEERFPYPFNGMIPASWSLRPITEGGLTYPEPWRTA